MKVKEITRKCSKTNYEGGILYRVSFTDIPDYAKKYVERTFCRSSYGSYRTSS